MLLALKIIAGLVILLVLLCIAVGLYNDWNVQRRGNGPGYDPAVPVLRTPEERFAGLVDFPYAPHYVEIRDDELGTLRVHYLDEGPRDGEIIVLLHGQATWSYSFRKFIPVLTAAGLRVIVPDLIGFGRSDKSADWEAHTFAKHTEWLDKTFRALGLQNVNAFLFDWGGYFALRVLADQPDLFSRVVLCTTTMPRANSLVGALWVAGWRRYILTPEEFPISGMVNQMTWRELDDAELAGLDAPYPDERYKGGPRRFPLMIPATHFAPATAANRAAWDKLANWDKPAITFVSEANAKRGFNPREFHEQLPGTAGQAHQTWANAGFFIIEDQPEALAQQTVEFIRAN